MFLVGPKLNAFKALSPYQYGQRKPKNKTNQKTKVKTSTTQTKKHPDGFKVELDHFIHSVKEQETL